MDPLIVVESTTHRYRTDALPALEGVELTIGRGEVTAVVGPSGGGKSTLLNLIGALDRPTAGAITAAGVRVDRLSAADAAVFRRGSVGFIFQFFLLIDDLTVLDNVRLPALLAGTPTADATRAATDLLERLGVAALRDRLPPSLSGGERQRVAIARAVINRPPIVLADEPTGALDTHNGEVVGDVLRDLGRAGHAVLLATHDRGLAGRIADRVIQL